MTPRWWITAGWVLLAATAGLAIVAIVLALEAVSSTCVQTSVTTGLVHSTCRAAVAEFVRGLICAVLAGVAFFSGLSCFFWAAHLRWLTVHLSGIAPGENSEPGVDPGGGRSCSR